MTAPTETDAGQLVRSLYLGVLRRDPEPEALAHWVGQLGKGREPAGLLDLLLNSEENRKQGSAARLAYRPGHFYSPIVDTAASEPDFRRQAAKSPPLSLPGIMIGLEPQVELWHRMLPFLREIRFPEAPTHGFRYHFANANFAYGNGSILYAVLRLFEPKRLIEIGSGCSSACALDTIDR